MTSITKMHGTMNIKDNVHRNVTMGQIQATTVAVGRQSILHIVSVCL